MASSEFLFESPLTENEVGDSGRYTDALHEITTSRIPQFFAGLFVLLMLVSTVSASYQMVENSSNIQYSNNTESFRSGGTYGIVTSLTGFSNISGSFSIQFLYKNNVGSASWYIYKNNATWANEFTMTSPAYKGSNYTFSNDILNSTDSVQIYCKVAAGNCYVDNLQVAFDFVAAPTILTPTNNSAQTSRQVNVTWSNIVGNVHLKVSENLDGSNPYVQGNSSTGYAYILFNNGLNYIFLRGYNGGVNETNWGAPYRVRIYNGVFLGSWYENYNNLNLSTLPFIQTNITNLSLSISSVGSRKESNITTANMTAHYKFNELSPTAQLIDEVNGYNATVYPSAGLAGGYNDRARNFSGSYANTSNKVNYSIVNKRTSIIIFRPNIDMISQEERIYHLVSSDDESIIIQYNGHPWERSFRAVTSNMSIPKGYGDVRSNTLTPQSNNTYHITIVVANNRIKLYLNGILNGNESFYGNIGSTTNHLYFGSDYLTGTKGNFTFDDYREYTNEWNASEVLNDYNLMRNNSANAPTNRSDVRLWLPFDNDSIDYSPYNNSHIAYGGVYPIYNSSGKYNSAAVGNHTLGGQIDYTIAKIQEPLIGLQSARAWIKFDNNSQRSIFMGVGNTTLNSWYMQINASGYLQSLVWNASGNISINSWEQKVEISKWYYVRNNLNDTHFDLIVDNVVVNSSVLPQGFGGVRGCIGCVFRTIGWSNALSFSGDFFLDDILYVTHSMSEEEGTNDYYTSIGTRLNASSGASISDYLWNETITIINNSLFQPKSITNVSWDYALSQNGINVTNTSNILFTVNTSIEHYNNISKGTEIINSTNYNVNVSHIAEKEYNNGLIFVGIDNSTVANSNIVENPVLVSNNTNASIQFANMGFIISTGALNVSDNFYYGISLEYLHYPPQIIDYYPINTNISILKNHSILFSLKADSESNISWYENDELTQTNNSVLNSSWANYTFNSGSIGLYIVNSTTCNYAACNSKIWYLRNKNSIKNKVVII